VTELITQLVGAPRSALETLDYAYRWVDWGLDCRPVRWPHWRQAVSSCYAFAGLARPERWVVVDSPLVGALAAPIAWYLLHEGHPLDVDEVVAAVLGDTDDEGLRRAVHRAVRQAAGEPARGGRTDVDARPRPMPGLGPDIDTLLAVVVSRDVVAEVDSMVAGPLGEIVGGIGERIERAVAHRWDALVGSVAEVPGAPRLRAALSRRWWDHFWPGQWDAAGHAHRAFFRDVCALGEDNDLRGTVAWLNLPEQVWQWSKAWQTACSAGWWWAHPQVVMACRRPRFVHRHQPEESYFSSRLHRADGPAIGWADGYALHAWHGTVVPAWVVDDARVERIVAERDLQVRRCGIEAMGLSRFVAAGGLRLLDECPDAEHGGRRETLALYEVPPRLNPYPQPARLLMATGYDPHTVAWFSRDFPRPTFVPASVPTALDAAMLTQQVRTDRDTLGTLLDTHGVLE
jgi:hypothetical protein